MNTYKFTATMMIETENEEKAKDIFANNSFDFASTTEVEEIDNKNPKT